MNAKISLSPHHPSLSQTMANPKAPPSVACTSHIEPLFHQGVFLMQRHALHNTRHIGRHPKSNVQYCCFTGRPTKPIGYLIGHSSLKPSDIDTRCAADHRSTTIPLFLPLLVMLHTAVNSQICWCQINRHTHNNNEKECLQYIPQSKGLMGLQYIRKSKLIVMGGLHAINTILWGDGTHNIRVYT